MNLTIAITAAQSGMWSQVIDQIQILPLDGNVSDTEIDRLEYRSQILDLALQVLMQGDFEEQWAIAKIIPKLGEIAIAPLLEIINDQDIDLEDRWFVARILGEFRQPQVVTALIATIQQGEDPELVMMATGALAKIGTVAISALADLLNTPDRRLAVTALAQIRHSQTIEPLLTAIDDPDPQVRTVIVEALGSFHDSRIPPILVAKLTDLAASVRRAAVVALTLRSDLADELNLVQHLRPCLFDLNLAVCSATAIGLARLSDPNVVDILTQVLETETTPAVLRSQLILALGWIGSREAIDSLATILPQVSAERAREIIISMSKTESERVYASQQLIAYLHQGCLVSNDLLPELDPIEIDRREHCPTIIRQEIVTALGNLGNIDAVEDLIQMLADPDDRVKLYTVAAISKLSPAMPPALIHLANRSDLAPELVAGVQMCISHWQRK